MGVEGPTAQVLYAASGGTNDFADKLGALGLCFELRPSSGGFGGFSPPASDILPGARESYAGIIAAIDYAKGYEPPAPTPFPSLTPAPTPFPTPANHWRLTGTGCDLWNDCISSNNYPANYGNNESCS